MRGLDYKVGDLPENENLVGDIYCGYGHCAEITTEDLNYPLLELYSPEEKENTPSWNSYPSWIYWGISLGELHRNS